MLYTSICSDRRAVRALNSSICAISDAVPYERCKLVSDVELFGMQLAFQVWVYFGCVGFLVRTIWFAHAAQFVDVCRRGVGNNAASRASFKRS